jgi:hypothetical protein
MLAEGPTVRGEAVASGALIVTKPQEGAPRRLYSTRGEIIASRAFLRVYSKVPTAFRGLGGAEVEAIADCIAQEIDAALAPAPNALGGKKGKRQGTAKQLGPREHSLNATPVERLVLDVMPVIRSQFPVVFAALREEEIDRLEKEIEIVAMRILVEK